MSATHSVRPARAPASVPSIGRFESSQNIRFAHCDPAGIVFFPQYLVMLNGLLEDWFNDGLCIRFDELLGMRRVGTPTVHLECDFTAISRMGDNLLLRLEVERIGRSSLVLRVDGSCGDEMRLRVRQVIVFTSLDTHKPIAIPDDVREAIVTRFTHSHEELQP